MCVSGEGFTPELTTEAQRHREKQATGLAANGREWTQMEWGVACRFTKEAAQLYSAPGSLTQKDTEGTEGHRSGEVYPRYGGMRPLHGTGPI